MFMMIQELKGVDIFTRDAECALATQLKFDY
eukprot:SAG11_NODE_4339_length_1942_cov_1.054259_1_plen_31_part_00